MCTSFQIFYKMWLIAYFESVCQIEELPHLKLKMKAYMRSVQKVSSHVTWNMETFTEEGTRNIAHRTMTPQPPSKLAPGDLTPFSPLPSSALLYFPKFHWQPEISSLSKVILVLEKSRSHRAQNLGCRGAESPGDLMFYQKNLHKMWWMSGHIVMMKLPVTSCS